MGRRIEGGIGEERKGDGRREEGKQTLLSSIFPSSSYQPLTGMK